MDRTRAVVICDEAGQPLRNGTLLEVHRGEGVLHKAFSVFVFRNAGADLLIQRRSPTKALFASRWANTCCSHPRPGDEPLTGAAERRLREEMGFSVPLREAGSFVYRARDPDRDASEYEHDTVVVGSTDGAISVRPDPAEIADWRWISIADLERELRDHAERYAPWLAEALRIALAAFLPDPSPPQRRGRASLDA
jgi:isopentenyl-diphosphate delta-isomerase